MTAIQAPVGGRSRGAAALAIGQIRYQLLLLRRSPMGTFTTLVVPLMLLVVLNFASPQVSVRELHGMRYATFLTPAMATFALLNASYVNVITSVAVARDSAVLKRLHGTPLPLWAYVVGRMASAAVVGLASIIVVFGVGAAFLHVHLDPSRVVALLGVAGLGVAAFTTLGMAVSSLVPRPDTALPVAYGTLLPIAFISDVFFPGTSGPAWLEHVADALPMAPIAKSAERIFTSGEAGWPVTHSQLVVILAWIGGGALMTALTFRWEPGESRLTRWLPGGKQH